MRHLLIEKVKNGFIVTNRGAEKFIFKNLGEVIAFLKVYGWG